MPESRTGSMAGMTVPELSPIDVLVNNVGGYWNTRHVTANALHPGVVRTSLGAEDPSGVQRLFVPLMRLFMKAPAQDAATSIYLASSADLEQVTGLYFANSKPKRSSERSYDEAVAARLWRVSADLVGLSPVGRTDFGATPAHKYVSLRKTPGHAATTAGTSWRTPDLSALASSPTCSRRQPLSSWG